jgi:hypothetical protein
MESAALSSALIAATVASVASMPRARVNLGSRSIAT